MRQTRLVASEPGDVELVRRLWESSGPDPAQALRYLDPDIEIHDFDVPDAGVFHGHSGWFDWIANWSAAWEDFGIEAKEFIAAGDGRVIVVSHLWARGRSGITLERRDGWLWTLRDGKAVRLDYYATRAEALQSAGVES